MNMGHEEEELLPYKEPTLDISDQKRIEILIGMGYPRVEVEESLRLHKFDDCYASYLLLGRKSTDVSFSPLFSYFSKEISRCGDGFPHSTFFYLPNTLYYYNFRVQKRRGPKGVDLCCFVL